MYIDTNLLKNEIQTQSGLLSEMKKDLLPSTSEMAKLALDKYLEDEFGSQKHDKIKIQHFIKYNTSDVLKKLLICETEIYRAIEEKIYRRFLDRYLKIYHKQEGNPFLELENLISYMQEKYKVINFSNIGEVFDDLYDVMRHVVFSEAQSRKSRVGHSLENHFENILRLLELPYQPQLDINDSIVDFVLPNENLLDDLPSNCLFLASQTTLKDRFRLSLSKISKRYSAVRKYIITASGLGLITSQDFKDLSELKVNAIKNQDFKLVVFSEVKQRDFKNESSVVSYEELINEEIDMFLDHWKRRGWI